MNQNRIPISAGIAVIVVLSLYVWFMSIGPWRVRGSTSDYYSQMASAFRHGQIALETKPDPALLALPNLYDPKARKNIPLLGDASVYEGKYYLYFGPLPSLPLALLMIIAPVHPGDQVFAYLFLTGLFLVQSLFFLAIFRRYFAGLPTWTIPLGILILGLSGPFTRMLAHPYIHEAAIAGGQFFSTTGLYLAFLALQAKPFDDRKLLFASLLWACAISTRITQIVPIGIMVGVTWLFVWNEHRKTKLARAFWSSTSALLAPLFFTGIALAWYNWVRFDSIFEFGLYYQLAAFNLQANYDALFSRIYLVQNIYNYFFNPFEIRNAFPFAFPLTGSEKSILAAHELPKLYIVEGKFPGLVNSTPLFLFALLPLLVLASRFIKGLRNRELRGTWFDPFDWTVVSLLASFVAGSLPTLLIFYVGFRYETEFITGLAMLGMIGVCQAYRLAKTPLAYTIWTATVAGLGIFSILANLALAFTGLGG